MIRVRAIAVASLLLLSACGGDSGNGDVDVTPVTGASGGLRLSPPAPERFLGQPTRIGFEPIPLEGGEFPSLVDFAFLPGGAKFLALNRAGKVGLFLFERDRAVLEASFQIPAVYTGGECGARSIAIDPNFLTNKLFYVGYCIDEQYDVVKRYTMSDDDFPETLYTAANVIAIGDPKADAPRHVIGSLAFGGDGALWMNVGDRNRGENAQNLENELGKVIRLQPIREQNVGGFTAPWGNAFTDRGSMNKLIYAYGLGDPRRGAFDSRGRYWVTDSTSVRTQEVNVVTAAGQNFGWPDADGAACSKGSCAGTVRPVRSWDASADHPFILQDPLSKSGSLYRGAWVGAEYRPVPQDPYKGLLTGKMLYGDFYLGYVRGATVDSTGRLLDDRHLGHIDLPVAWRQGVDGYLYVGTLYQSFDRAREAEGDANLLPQAKQGRLWRVVPLP